MNKRLLLLIAVLAGILLLPSSISAHELLKDQVGDAGALLHTDPDDNPVAGGRTTLFFDISDSTVTPKSSQASLTITDDHGVVTNIPFTFVGSSITARYVFPRQGSYKVQLTIKQDGRTVHLFSEPLSIGRSSSGSAPAWAKIGLVATAVVAAYAALIAFNRRKAIQKYSKL